MATDLKVLGICGSLRKGSLNMAALRAAQELAPPGMSIELYDHVGELPLFNQDHEKEPSEVVADFKRQIREADAILFGCPEYNFSLSGVLKNALDVASRPGGDSAWTGKPAAIMGVSGGRLGTARAQYDLRKVMVTLNMFALNRPEVMIGFGSQVFNEQGKLTDEATREHLGKFLAAFAEWALRLKAGEVQASAG